MDFMDILSKFFETVLVALAPVLVGFAVAYLKAAIDAKAEEIKLQSPDVYELVMNFANQAVLAAEQAGANDFVDNKLAYAFNLAEKWLEQYEIDIDIDLIYAAIEAEVKREFGKD